TICRAAAGHRRRSERAGEYDRIRWPCQPSSRVGASLYTWTFRSQAGSERIAEKSADRIPGTVREQELEAIFHREADHGVDFGGRSTARALGGPRHRRERRRRISLFTGLVFAIEQNSRVHGHLTSAVEHSPRVADTDIRRYVIILAEQGRGDHAVGFAHGLPNARNESCIR